MLPVLPISDYLPISLILNFVDHAEYYKHSQSKASRDVKLIFDSSKSVELIESMRQRDDTTRLNGDGYFLNDSCIAVIFNTAKEFKMNYKAFDQDCRGARSIMAVTFQALKGNTNNEINHVAYFDAKKRF